MNRSFDIKIIRQHWVDDAENDNPDDLCSHGEIYVRIGRTELSTKESGSWTLSSTALYLLRTIHEDYEAGKYASQLIPCCGHFFIADEKNPGAVSIIGCPNGIDWTICHLPDGRVKHTADNGDDAIISKDAYMQLVRSVVEQVEVFYTSSAAKNLPNDEHDRNGYEAFWNEWHMRKARLDEIKEEFNSEE